MPERFRMIRQYEELVAAYPHCADAATNLIFMVGEVGEYAHLLKDEHLADVDGRVINLRSEQQQEKFEELADILWHVTKAALIMGENLDSLIQCSYERTVAKRKIGVQATTKLSTSEEERRYKETKQ